jgi:hypothetical protein
MQSVIVDDDAETRNLSRQPRYADRDPFEPVAANVSRRK